MPLQSARAAAPIVVHSALRWDPAAHAAHRRLAALAADAPLLFVEPPVLLDDVRGGRLELDEAAPGVARAVPRLPGYLWERGDTAPFTVRALLQHALRAGGPLGERFAAPVLWLCGAGAAPAMLGAFGERAVVYECAATPADVPVPAASRHEPLLLSRATLVLAADHAAYDALRTRHPRVHLGVDAPQLRALLERASAAQAGAMAELVAAARASVAIA